MPANRRMFWNVRATLASAAIWKSGMRSSRNTERSSGPRENRLPVAVSAATSASVAPPPSNAMRPDDGL